MSYGRNQANYSQRLRSRVKRNLSGKTSEWMKPPSLVRSSSNTSDDGEKIYYNAEADMNHRTVPHDPYSIQINCGNAVMTSPIYANYN